MQLNSSRISLAMSVALACLIQLANATPPAKPLASQPSTSASTLPFESQSELVGEYLKAGRGIQVADLGGGNYRVTLFAGGLPTQGWDKSEPQVLETDEEDVTDLLEGAERIERTSPTLGMSPPSNSVVLFDGSEKSLTENWEPGAKLADGLLVAGATTRSKFRDYRLHLEFQVPIMPEALGQARGNSGVYHQGRYETQVLDSFGFENAINTSGAIYGVRTSNVNASLPPSQWQTYDVEFTAARWDANGQKIQNAKLTAKLNGVVIHTDVEVPGPTTAAPFAETPEPGPIYLQDHGNPVHYRNIWIVPIDADELAKRPRVAGFERLSAMIDSETSEETTSHYRNMAGQVLINDLGCISCHASNAAELSQNQKVAPDLSKVGSRLRRGYIAQLLESPHAQKPGTTMPDLLANWPAAEKQSAIQSLAAYLESTGAPQRPPRFARNSARRGERLYNEIGCVICHAMPDGSGASATTIPLPDLSEKYTANGLALFLKDPHAVRPSGRMPAMHLSDDESRDLVSYLVASKSEESSTPNFSYQVYSGSWDKLPDFETLTSKRDGQCAGLDISVAREQYNYAIRFHSYVAIDTKGRFRFHLGSDDGSKLFIDDQLIADCDGVHPHQFASGEIELDQGVHQIRVEYFQGGGEASLELEWEGPTFPRQSIEPWLAIDPEAARNLTKTESVNTQLVNQGRTLFQSVGCVNCHAMPGLSTDGNNATQTQFAKSVALEQADLAKGCLSEKPGNAPRYYLSDKQRDAIAATIANSKPIENAEAKLQFHMTQFNCVACHERNGFGGPESHNLAAFTTTIPEMGDEGRVPPKLNGVGDKLRDEFLSEVLTNGVRHRPYMRVRMPSYGKGTAGMAPLFQEQDRPNEERSALLPPDETNIKALAAGRKLAGTKGLSCAQCHTFGNVAATGIQALDMQLMTKRVRPEWFYRYLMEPTKYRPGTRMPNSFPDGESVFKQIYDGNAEHQIAALWLYLDQGNQAALPDGLQRDQIVLEPTDRPVIYRNFLEGLSARGIAVGYPGGVNIAWDAETMALKTIWQGSFIDASLHWRDRGVGRQKPLGDLVVNLDGGPAVAYLANSQANWPNNQIVSAGYQFLGYRLSQQGSPTFRYKVGEPQAGEVEADDTFETDVTDKENGLRRVITLNPSANSNPAQPSDSATTKTLVVRLARGNEIVATGDGEWMVDKQIKIRVLGDEALGSHFKNVEQINSQNGTELRMVIDPSKLPSAISYTIHW